MFCCFTYIFSVFSVAAAVIFVGCALRLGPEKTANILPMRKKAGSQREKKNLLLPVFCVCTTLLKYFGTRWALLHTANNILHI